MNSVISTVPATQAQVCQCAAQSRVLAARQRISTSHAGSESSVHSRDAGTSESSRTSRPRLTRGEQHTPDPCSSQPRSSTTTAAVTAAPTAPEPKISFVDRDSDVVFSHLFSASGARITTRDELHKARTSGPSPSLRLTIPPASPSPAALEEDELDAQSNSNGSGQPDLPTFALTLASPISPRSPILPPTPTLPFTHASYLALASRAPPTARVPYLPQTCPHIRRALSSADSSDDNNCPACAVQLMACDVWWSSRASGTVTTTVAASGMEVAEYDDDSATVVTAASRLCAPRLLPGACTPTTRAIFYALGIPLGELDPSCVDWDVVGAILFMRRRGGGNGGSVRAPVRRAAPARSNKKAAFLGGRASSSRIRMLFHRARQFLTTPMRVPIVPIPILSRRVIARA